MARNTQNKKHNPENIQKGDCISIIWPNTEDGFEDCKYSNRLWTVHGVSKRGHLLYYIDNRTNIKCKCRQCNSRKVPVNNGKGGFSYYKTIKTSRVKYFMTEKQVFRELRLRKILNNKKKI